MIKFKVIYIVRQQLKIKSLLQTYFFFINLQLNFELSK